MELPAGSSRVKVIPKRRRYDRTKAGDLICMKAWAMKVSRAELGEAAGISEQYVNKVLVGQPKYLTVRHIEAFCKRLEMTPEETRQVYHAAALEQGYLIGQYIPRKKKNGAQV